MSELFIRSLLAFVVGGMAGVAVCAAGVTSPVLQAAAGMVSYFAMEALAFRAA